jgi:hypothetical protein
MKGRAPAGQFIEKNRRGRLVKKWIVVLIALSAFAFYEFGQRQMVTIGWDRNPAASSYNCYLDGKRVATHVSSDALRCTMPVSVGRHTVTVTAVAVVSCGSDGRFCDSESRPASLKIVKLPFLKARAIR